VKYLIVIILVLSILSVNGLVNERSIIETNRQSIDEIVIKTTDDTIYLDVHLNKELSCINAIKELDVQEFVIEGEVYKPLCTKLKPSLLRIIFKKSISV
jgi:hypothetical protein